MISTRQLIFIINIVFFFFNPATSCNNNSASELYGAAEISKCYRFLFYEEEATASNDDEITINKEEVNSEHIQYCKMELFTAFKMENPFDNFLYAFKHLKKSDFEVPRGPQTFAAVEYYFDLLCTAYDIDQPELLKPQDYCESRYNDEIEDCLYSIEDIGCDANLSGIICVKKLYLYWKQEEMPSLIPLIDAASISDEDLENAVSRGIKRFPDLSTEELLESLSDSSLSEAFYFENELRRLQVEHLFYLGTYTDYRSQRQIDIQDARDKYFGIRDKSYEILFKEYNRRKNLFKLFGHSYAMYLYNQLETCETSKFRDREQFCKKFLLEYPDYYNFLYK